jgi:DNA-binding transcriptional regulator YiaG
MNTETAIEIAEARYLARTGAGARLRLQAGLSQADIARACGVSAAAVSRWEAGIRAPSAQRAVVYIRLIHQIARRVPGLPDMQSCVSQAADIDPLHSARPGWRSDGNEERA